MTVVVRKARSDEVEAARQLTNRSWLTTYAPLIGKAETETIIADRHSTVRFEEQSAQPGHMFLVAVRDGVIVGHCHAYPDDGIYIDRLHVEPDLKRGGVGRAMLEHVEGSLPKGTRIWLEALDGNDNAIAFYLRTGYAQTGLTDACGGLAGIPAHNFEKTLS